MEIPRYSTSDFDPAAEFGFLQQNSVKETAPMHTHEFFEIFLVTDGQALHLVNDAVQNIQQGDLVLIRPDDLHCYDYYQSFDFRFINIAFSIETLSLISDLFTPEKPFAVLISAPLPPVTHLSPEESGFAAQELSRASELRRTASPEYARYYFRSLLSFLLCRHFFLPQNRPEIPRWLAQAVTSMHAIANFQQGLPKMLSLCSCSEEHLCREFKRHYHTTPVAFINRLRLEYAAYLLSNTQQEIIDICGQCGFGNLSHFYHLFREKFGLSPGKYRAAARRAELP